MSVPDSSPDVSTSSLTHQENKGLVSENPYLAAAEAHKKDNQNQTFSFSDADVVQAKKEGDIIESQKVMEDLIKEHPDQADKIRERYNKLMTSIGEQSHSVNKARPELLIDHTDNNLLSGGYASAMESKSHTPYVTMTKESFEASLLDDDELKKNNAVLGHEIAHLRQGDTTPHGMKDRTDVAVSRRQEALADLKGGGPMESHNADKLEQKFKEFILDDREAYNAAHPDAKIGDNPKDEDLKKISDWQVQTIGVQNFDHPSSYDRVIAMRKEAQLMNEYEAKWSQDHPGKEMSHGDKKKEEEYVIHNTLQYMDGKWDPPIADTKKSLAMELQDKDTVADLKRERTDGTAAMLEQAGSGKNGSPNDMIQQFVEKIRSNVDDFNKANRGDEVNAGALTDKSLKAVSEWLAEKNPTSHSASLWDDISALKIEERLMGAYGKTPTGASADPDHIVKERKQETEAVIPQVFKEMGDKWQLPQEGLPQLPLEMLHAMKNSMNATDLNNVQLKSSPDRSASEVATVVR